MSVPETMFNSLSQLVHDDKLNKMQSVQLTILPAYNYDTKISSE
jgi:hypothetical protein